MNTTKADYNYGLRETIGTGDHKPTMTTNGTYTKPINSPAHTKTDTGITTSISTGCSTGGQSSTTPISSAENMMVAAGLRDVLALIGMSLGSVLLFIGL
ncbi:hypothetical protein BGZ60DRAFT_527734 [Tricladium varicosporioides]|nr:hypothetical protein BGZ60DRAFT_527734 [Hymenoscyphus varicosporioides]